MLFIQIFIFEFSFLHKNLALLKNMASDDLLSWNWYPLEQKNIGIVLHWFNRSLVLRRNDDNVKAAFYGKGKKPLKPGYCHVPEHLAY